MQLTKDLLINLNLINNEKETSFDIKNSKFWIKENSQNQDINTQPVIVYSYLGGFSYEIDSLEKLDRAVEYDLFEKFISLIEEDIYVDIVTTITNSYESEYTVSEMLSSYINQVSEVYNSLFEKQYKDKILNKIIVISSCFSSIDLNIKN